MRSCGESTQGRQAARRDLEGSLGARWGPYRILYEIDDTTEVVRILRVDHRAGVYRSR
ncbi:MAG: type II toxin-antitoxin system RelE/ParE family toxin [Actinomycetota bacterium]|nr:type II toxin-antitoxin system RelE/ParE family toxin [Actinomycetota bacterium]